MYDSSLSFIGSFGGLNWILDGLIQLILRVVDGLMEIMSNVRTITDSFDSNDSFKNSDAST